MKKICSFFLSCLIAASALIGSGVIAYASTSDKADIKANSNVDVAKYDVKSGTFECGKIKVVPKKALNANKPYLVYDESTYKSHKGTVSKSTKANLEIIAEVSYNAMQEYMAINGSKVDMSRFGPIDSESYTYPNSTIAPIAVPEAIKKGIDENDYMWLVVGDKKGGVISAYINLSSKDVDREPTTTPSEPTTPANPSGENEEVKVLVPRKMSLRLEDGTVLKNGEKFSMEIGKEYKFQMCSNNWDNDTYDDNGNGIAGTVVYKAILSNTAKKNTYNADDHMFTISKADKALRTDTNSCFMAYRYHFKKGDYNKQTGIVNVVNTPLESLSVNLPLGSTIASDAYKANSKIDTANVFVETAADKTICYTDYYWQY